VASRRLSCLAGLLLAAPTAQAQLQSQPQQVPSSPLRKAMTIETMDQGIANMSRAPWELPAQLGNPPPDESGRRMDDDLAEYFFTEPVLAKMHALRDEIAASTAPGAEIDAAKAAPLNQLLQSESCRLMVIGTYWHKRYSRDYHHDMILGLVDRLPSADQVAAKNELQAIDARGKSSRALVAAGMKSCDMLAQAASLASTPEILAADTREEGYNTLRMKLVAQLSAARGDATHEQTWMQRSTSCPALAEPPSGTHGPKARVVPDVRDYYPAEAINLTISGSAKVRMHYDDTGCVIEASILESTGSELLDGAALRLALAYALTAPAVDGVSKSGYVALPINFGIHDLRGVPLVQGPNVQLQP
jgi:TonB family protein